MASALVAGPVTSAPPGHAFPAQAADNYDIRSDHEPDGAFTAILAGTNSGTGIGVVEIYNAH